MKKFQTIYDKWTIDFKKILFCMGVLYLGTIYNMEEPKAFAVAVIVQGVSNIGEFWDYLDSERICVPLKILSVIVILLSVFVVLFAFHCLTKSKDFYDLGNNSDAAKYMWGSLIAVASPLVPIVADAVINVVNKVISDKRGKLINRGGGEEDEL